MSQLLQGKTDAATDNSFTPDHFWNGFGFEADGALSIDTVGAIDHHHQGLPFTAEGRLCMELGDVSYIGNGAAPFTVGGRLALGSGAVDNYLAGVPYTAGGGLVLAGGSQQIARYTALDPNNKAAIMILSEDNLRCVSDSAATRGVAFSVQGVTTGKVYWEALSLSAASAQGFGIGQASTNMTSFLGAGVGDWGYFPSGAYWTNNTNTGTGSGYGIGDILGFALDMAGNLDVYVNGILSFSVAHGLTGLTWAGVTDASTGAICNMMMNFGSDSSFGGRDTAQGNSDSLGVGDFYYAPPAGYLALSNKIPLLYDTFDDVNETLVINHVPNAGAQAYQFAVDTSPKIVGNAVFSSIAGRQICGYDVGQVNKKITFNILGIGALVVFRLRVDMAAVDQNHVYFYRTTTVMQIIRLQAGAATTLATANRAFVAGEQVIITDDGFTITASVDGQEITAGTAFLDTLTTMGLQVNGINTSIDNLLIEDLTI